MNASTTDRPREPVVFVIEDEPALRSLLLRIFSRASINVEAFASAEDFLQSVDPLAARGCLLVDMSLPGMDGLALQQTLLARQVLLPLIFLTGSADVSKATAGMRAGALDLIEKPFDADHLLNRVRDALDVDTQRRAERTLWEEVDARLTELTAREREVLDQIVDGHTNKTIAQHLETSPRTVEVHRARIMRKMKAASLPELVKLMLIWRAGQG